MGLETAIIAGGMALGAGANAYGANKQAKANKSAADQQQKRYEDLRGRVDGSMNGGYDVYENLGLQTLPAFMPGSAQMYDPSQVSINALREFLPGGALAGGGAGYAGDVRADQVGLNSPAFNVGQDALLQFLRADPTRSREVDQNVAGMAADGSAYNVSQLAESLRPLEQRALDEGMAAISGSVGGLGQRFGSATTRQMGEQARRLTEDANARRDALGFQAHESAQGRKLGANQLLAGLEGQRAQALMSGLGAALGFADTSLRPQLANQQANLSAAQGNQATRQSANNLNAQLANQRSGSGLNAMLQAMMFNAGQSNQANQFNINSGLQQRAQFSQYLNQLAGLRGMQNQHEVSLLSLLAGQQAPMAPQGQGATAGAIGQGFGDMAMLPLIMQLMGNGGTK